MMEATIARLILYSLRCETCRAVWFASFVPEKCAFCGYRAVEITGRTSG
jgi:rRNA maturation endonuclease Nob1